MRLPEVIVEAFLIPIVFIANFSALSISRVQMANRTLVRYRDATQGLLYGDATEEAGSAVYQND